MFKINRYLHHKKSVKKCIIPIYSLFNYIGVCEKKIASATDKPDKRTSLYGSKIEECLKDLFKKAEIVDGEHCSAAIATLIEATHLDIQADPLLNR